MLENAAPMQSHQHHALSGTARVRSTVKHFVQLFIAMEVGMTLYMLFARGLAPDSYHAIVKEYPLYGYWTMMAAMAVPMVALMRWHLLSWRICVQMTIAMLAPVVALTGLNLFGVISYQVANVMGHLLMTLGMLLYLIGLDRVDGGDCESHAGHDSALSERHSYFSQFDSGIFSSNSARIKCWAPLSAFCH